MSVNYSASTKTARMTAVRDKIDAGSGAGKLKIGTTGMSTVLATWILNDPSGTISGSVLTFSGFPKTDAADAAGTPAEAVMTDSDDNIVISGLTVGLSGTDVIVDSTTLALAQNFTIQSATITHAS
jgi:hypothetical protein